MADSRIENLLTKFAPLPTLIVSGSGKIKGASRSIGDVFLYDNLKDADFYAITGYKLPDLLDENTTSVVSKNGKAFRLLIRQIRGGAEGKDAAYAAYFIDVTNYQTLKELYVNERASIIEVNIDNFEELVDGTAEENVSALVSGIDKRIRQWAKEIGGVIVRTRESSYFIFFESQWYDKLVGGNFAILDEVRKIETETDFPVTLSIGMGMGGKSLIYTEEYAQIALELAQGRGGDQAVVKKASKLEYYGGKTNTVEKSNKSKSRIVGHALNRLLDQADRVFIMGHTNPDMDSFGAALGLFRLAENSGRETHIVISTYNEALAEIFLQAKETEVYSFINREKALSMVTEESLVIVVDTHRPSYTECPELLEQTDRIAVIDHHRKGEECIENPLLIYQEPYASSTSELVSEIIQYTLEKKAIRKLEAEALLAGIAVDTNQFAVKTGVRTFEAASWLRRMGADTTEVKRFFQSDAVSFTMKARCISRAEFLEGGYALSMCEGTHPNIQIINSQAADELLEIKGVRASVVIGCDDRGRTVICARSLGDVNVQVIMEQFGGGGHLTTAGAQVTDAPEYVMEKLRALLEETGRASADKGNAGTEKKG